MWARSSRGAGRTIDQSTHAHRLPKQGGEPVGPYTITTLAGRDAEALLSAYRRAEAHALDPDPFMDPAAIAAAAVHERSLRDLRVVCICRDEAVHGLFPLRPAGGFLRERRWEVPLLDPAATGAPFLHREHADTVVETLHGWLARRGLALALTGLAADTRLAELARIHAETGMAQIKHRHPSDTATRVGETRDQNDATSAGMVLDRSSDAGSLREAVEFYLFQEAQMAMAAGTEALVQRTGAANGIRALTRSLGRDRRCQAFTLRDHTGPHAVALVLHARDHAVLWRLTVDPDGGISLDWMRKRVLRAVSQRRSQSITDAAICLSKTRLNLAYPVRSVGRSVDTMRRSQLQGRESAPAPWRPVAGDRQTGMAVRKTQGEGA
jgi:hypothetical protein